MRTPAGPSAIWARSSPPATAAAPGRCSAEAASGPRVRGAWPARPTCRSSWSAKSARKKATSPRSSLLHPSCDAADARSREAMLLAGATATNLAWQFPLPPDDAARTPEELLAELNRANDGRAVERLERYLVRAAADVAARRGRDASRRAAGNPIRSRRSSSSWSTQSLRAAGDPNQYPELAADVGPRAVAGEKSLRRAAAGLARRRADHDRPVRAAARGDARRLGRAGAATAPCRRRPPRPTRSNCSCMAASGDLRTARLARRVRRHSARARRRRAAAAGESAERRRRHNCADSPRGAGRCGCSSSERKATRPGPGKSRISPTTSTRRAPANCCSSWPTAIARRASSIWRPTRIRRSPAAGPSIRSSSRRCGGSCSSTRAAKRPSGSPIAMRQTIVATADDGNSAANAVQQASAIAVEATRHR